MAQLLKILLIEDDSDDIELLEEAFRENNITYSLEIIREGDKVLHYLETVKTLPHVIVLDFNLPKIHGRKILQTIKSNVSLKDVPLIVLTTSAAKEDELFSISMGAKHFITKPVLMQDFSKIVKLIVKSAKFY